MSVFFCDARDDLIREQNYLRTLLSRVYAFISSAAPDDCSSCAIVLLERNGNGPTLSHRT
ncbi:hypothetical protein [Actinoplanes sp. URMC 104]|uniref:hypothetical protein n=1 Tax=Actinoplanes sp. URMC 104 TaxID=3423409 RepID=UPI003F1C9308